jgi:endonuclease YncB( thermonuclease family)
MGVRQVTNARFISASQPAANDPSIDPVLTLVLRYTRPVALLGIAVALTAIAWAAQSLTRFLFAATLALASLSVYADFTGKVVAVADGDTVTVLRDKEQVKIRLAGIDAPDMQVPSKKS